MGAPMDMFEQQKKKNNIKLYVRRVFIMDDCEELIPDWLGFVKGLVDSEDLPLNISRETLQHNRILKVVRKNLIKKSIELFEEIAEDAEKYKTFYEQFSKSLKLGVHEDSTNRERLAKLTRWHTSLSGDDMISLDDYVTNMKEGQNDIYWIGGASRHELQNSPFVEKLKKKGIAVILASDAIDEYMYQQLKSYSDKKIVCLSKEDAVLPETDEEKKEREEAEKNAEELTKKMKEILANDVEKVVISSKLVDSPCAISSTSFGWSANMERIMKAQALKGSEMGSYMSAKKVLEVNPTSPIVKELVKRVAADPSDKAVADITRLLFDTALLTSGFQLNDPASYAKRITRMVALGLSLDTADDDAAAAGGDDD